MMMDSQYNIYCDESRHTSDPSDRYMVIGAIQCPREDKHQIVRDIHLIRKQYSTQGEFGWKRLSPNRQKFYFALIEYFIGSNALSFRCIIADKKNFVIDDEELGFYKLYYQMLHNWLNNENEYYIYLDHRVNAKHNRLLVLEECLKRNHSIRALESGDSKNMELMQLADLMIGAVGYEKNERDSSAVKVDFCQKLANQLDISSISQSTYRTERKFNVFCFGSDNG